MRWAGEPQPDDPAGLSGAETILVLRLPRRGRVVTIREAASPVSLVMARERRLNEMKRLMSLAGVAVVLLAACAHHSTSGGGASPGAGSGGLQVEAKTVTGVGTVLVDGSSGKTLYLLSAESGGKVTCTGGCASVW